jgi:hypothetical protein
MTLPRASEINRDTNGPLWVQAHILELRAEVDSILNGAAKAEFAALLADLKVVRADVLRMQTEVNADRAKMLAEHAAFEARITQRLVDIERQIEKLSQKDSQ